MSLLPLLREVEDFLVEDTFGNGLYPMDIVYPRYGGLKWHSPRRYCPYGVLLKYRPSREADATPRDEEDSMPTVGKDGFQVCMNVAHFKPNELTVKTKDRCVVVEGKHEEREDDHGFIQRHFVRKYMLPKGYDPKEVVSTISSDGVLTVKAPPPAPAKLKGGQERVIQIQQTGPAHLSVKAPETAEAAKKAEGNGANEPQKMDTK